MTHRIRHRICGESPKASSAVKLASCCLFISLETEQKDGRYVFAIHQVHLENLLASLAILPHF